MRKVFFILIFATLTAANISTAKEFDIWTTVVDKDFCIIDGGIIADRGGKETRIVAQFITPKVLTDKIKRMNLSVGSPQLVILPYDNTLKEGYEIILAVGDNIFRAWPKNSRYVLPANHTKDLLNLAKSHGSFSVVFKLKEGGIAKVDLGFSNLQVHIKEAKNCGYTFQ